MQKIINVLAISSFAISLTVVGGGVYLYTQKDAIIENVKSKVMKSVMPSIGGGITDAIPDFTGPAAPVQPTAPMPEGVGLGIPNF